jgi:hypothetical protein
VFTRRSCSLCSSQRRGRDDVRLEAAVRRVRSGARRRRRPFCLSKQPEPPDAKPGGSEAASSKQSSEGRALEGSVVPATARPKAPENFQLAGAPGSSGSRATHRPVLDVGTSRQSDNIRVRTGQWVP